MFFFFNDTATTEIYTLSLHDALPIYQYIDDIAKQVGKVDIILDAAGPLAKERSEEHTSELQSRLHLVCRLLLEKKKRGLARAVGADDGADSAALERARHAVDGGERA